MLQRLPNIPQEQVSDSPGPKVRFTYLFHALHLAFLLFEVFLLLLPSLVNASDKSLDISLMSEAIFMLLARGGVVGNVDIAVFAEILLFGDPIIAHGGDLQSGRAADVIINDQMPSEIDWLFRDYGILTLILLSWDCIHAVLGTTLPALVFILLPTSYKFPQLPCQASESTGIN
jgi:hypothetical protein